MEFVTRRNRKCKKKRRSRKRLRDQVRVEVQVRSATHRKVFSGHTNAFCARETLAANTMQADAFWKNYTAAQEWQKRHNVTWWKSRCIALEHENEVLRGKIRSLVQQLSYPKTMTTQERHDYEEDAQEKRESDSDVEDLEFTVNEDMLKFFEKSERHRREMKEKYESDNVYEDVAVEQISVTDGDENACARKEETNLLYDDVAAPTCNKDCSTSYTGQSQN